METIHNSATGETIGFVTTARAGGGELLVMEDRWPAGHVVAAHLHPGMQETWTALEGRALIRVGEEEAILGPGDSVTAPAGTVHSGENLNAGPTLLRIEMRPPLRWEEFTRRLFALQNDPATPPQAYLDLLGDFPEEVALPQSP